MIGLGAVCVVLVIVLIAFAASQCGKDNTSGTTKATTETTEIQTETTIASDPSGSAVITDPSGTPGAEILAVFEFSDDTGFRTWWDLFYTVYGIKLDKNDDPRIATIIAYNQKPADYVPQPGDRILLPPSSMFTTAD